MMPPAGYDRMMNDARDLDAWITRQMVTDARVIQETYAGPPDAREQAAVDHQIRRRVLKLHGWDDPDGILECPVCEPDLWWPCATVQLVILAWANREGYRAAWSPGPEGM